MTRLVGWDGLRDRGITANRATIYRWMKNKRFPQSLKQGEWRICWLAHEVDQWIEQQAANRT